jgi:hypothetical protein
MFAWVSMLSMLSLSLDTGSGSAEEHNPAPRVQLACTVTEVSWSENPDLEIAGSVYVKIDDVSVSIYNMTMEVGKRQIDTFKIDTWDDSKIWFKSTGNKKLAGSINRLSGDLEITDENLPVFAGKCERSKRLF